MTVYLNYKGEPLEQVPADGLQNKQLCGCLVQGEILSIGPGMTWEESVMVLMLQNRQTDVTFARKIERKAAVVKNYDLPTRMW